jgi:hypothetical protein
VIRRSADRDFANASAAALDSETPAHDQRRFSLGGAITEQQSVLPDINRKDFVLTENTQTAAKIAGTPTSWIRPTDVQSVGLQPR